MSESALCLIAVLPARLPKQLLTASSADLRCIFTGVFMRAFDNFRLTEKKTRLLSKQTLF